MNYQGLCIFFTLGGHEITCISELHDSRLFSDDTIKTFAGHKDISTTQKCTAADLILGILEPLEGTVTIDGTNINKCMESWHEKIGYIPQTIYLMDDTIRTNIAFGVPESEIDDTAIEKALREAQLDQFVHSSCLHERRQA